MVEMGKKAKKNWTSPAGQIKMAKLLKLWNDQKGTVTKAKFCRDHDVHVSTFSKYLDGTIKIGCGPAGRKPLVSHKYMTGFSMLFALQERKDEGFSTKKAPAKVANSYGIIPLPLRAAMVGSAQVASYNATDKAPTIVEVKAWMKEMMVGTEKKTKRADLLAVCLAHLATASSPAATVYATV